MHVVAVGADAGVSVGGDVGREEESEGIERGERVAVPSATPSVAEHSAAVDGALLDGHVREMEQQGTRETHSRGRGWVGEAMMGVWSCITEHHSIDLLRRWCSANISLTSRWVRGGGEHGGGRVSCWAFHSAGHGSGTFYESPPNGVSVSSQRPPAGHCMCMLFSTALPSISTPLITIWTRYHLLSTLTSPECAGCL